MDAPTIQLHLPPSIAGYGGGVNSLRLVPYNKLYLDNKLSNYIKGSSMVAIKLSYVLIFDKSTGMFL